MLAGGAIIDVARELRVRPLHRRPGRRGGELGMVSVRARRARPQRRRTSKLDAASAWTRPSRARIDAQDFSTKGNRRRTMSGVAGSSRASTSWPAARGPNLDRALTTWSRMALFASSGMIAPI